MSETVYKPVELTEIRAKLKLTQARMAEYMGMPFRTYQALEGGQNPLKRPHMLAARYAAILSAIDEADPKRLPDDVADEVIALAAMITADRP